MKIQCDVCEKAPATLICCADEAALCAKCDVEIHAANKLASKHQRLLLNCLSDKLPRCDICQEKTAFIFCVEDRALFCKECDEPIHSPGSRSANHQRLLATGIRIGLSSPCTTKDTEPATNFEPPSQKAPPPPPNVKVAPSPQLLGYSSSPSWAIDDFLQLQEFEPNDKKEAVGFGGLEWFSDIGLFDDGQMRHAQEGSAAAEVPQLPIAQAANSAHFRPSKSSAYSYKKARIEIADEEEYFTVPDLG